MSQRPSQNFIAAQAFDAIYEDIQGKQNILVELRFKANRSCLLFTMINGEPVRAKSIQDFVLDRSDCLSLTITHSLRILWNGVFKNSQLVECYLPKRETPSVDVRVTLLVDGDEYDSGNSPSLTEALFTIDDYLGSKVTWWLEACHECKFSYSAFPLDLTDDRNELQCYRDAPEDFAEVQQKHKFASEVSHYAGAYFVTAFHKCAAWQPPDKAKL